MLNKNQVSTSGVVNLKAEDTSLYYVPLLQIKVDKVAVSDMIINSEIIVRWFSADENYFNKYFVKYGVSGGETILQFNKIGDSEGVGIDVCFVKTDDDNYILYAKGGNRYIDINAQVVYCDKPNTISEPYGISAISVSDISTYETISPTDFKTLTLTPGSDWYIAKNDYHQFLKIDKSGMCIINATVYKNAVITSGEIIAKVNNAPYDKPIQIILQYTKIGETSTNGTCRGHINTSGEIKILKGIDYPCHITIFTIYQSINNSI